MESWEVKKWGLMTVGIVIAAVSLAYGTEVETVETATRATYSYNLLACLGALIGTSVVFVGAVIDKEDC